MRFDRDFALAFLAMAFVALFSPLISAGGGALAGYMLAPLVEQQVQQFFAHFGVKGFLMWHFGLILGFISGFFRSKMAWPFVRSGIGEEGR